MKQTSTLLPSRWGDGDDLNALSTSMSLIIPPGLTSLQLSAYFIEARMDEINRLLKMPSAPFPLNPGDSEGEWRLRLEQERLQLVQSALKYNAELFSLGTVQINGSYANTLQSAIPGVPSNCRFAEKIYLPARDYPEINFVGLLIGPRGNTLRRMENETGAKISIRGQGAQKDGRISDATMLATADEELHAVVMAETLEKFEKAVALVNKIIETACSMPEQANELKQQQLRELAMLNASEAGGAGAMQPAIPSLTASFFDDVQGSKCPICGQLGHSRYECRQQQPMANRLLCRICGGAGHISSDCAYRDDPSMLNRSLAKAQQIDAEYAAFMNEINMAAQSVNAPTATSTVAPGESADASAAPWASGLQADE